MSDYVGVTTAKNFTLEDVTHKPKRMQGDNLPKEESEESVQKFTDVPQAVTLEKAIKFYEDHAEGEYKKLYSNTAKWLRDIVTRKADIIEKVVDKITATPME